MALDHRAEAVVKVPHAVAIDVVDDGPLTGGEVDRPGVTGLVAGGDAAAERLAGPLVHLRGALGALVEAGCFALDQAAHPIAGGLNCRLRGPPLLLPWGVAGGAA